MNEQDCRAVENVCYTGMDLDGLVACFPEFPKEEIERIFTTSSNRSSDDAVDTLISINC